MKKSTALALIIFVLIYVFAFTSCVEPCTVHYKVAGREGNTVILLNMETGETTELTTNKAESYKVGDDLLFNTFER